MSSQNTPNRTTVIPFGPQHPVLPEPLHLNLVVENETVLQATPALGYVHRGLENLATIRDFQQMVYVVERVCGICSCIHAQCYCQCLELMMNIDVPVRARYLRVIWSELHRMHSHLLWLGLHADAFGFESLFMQFWKIREKIMDINEATTGNRVIVSTNIVGGVRRDLSQEHIAWILTEMTQLEKEMKRLSRTILDDYTVRARTVDKGVLTAQEALHLGAVGPVLRACGVAEDARTNLYAPLEGINFEPVTSIEGDAWARSKVRYDEVLQSVDLVRQAIAHLPDSPLSTPFKGNPMGEAVGRMEQPRGEMLYYIKANGTKNLSRVRIRTPTFANIPALLHMLNGAQLADVPILALTIDPCISCTER